MRTITKTMKKVLNAQAHEASVQGFVKISQQLTEVTESSPVRNTEDDYVYEQDELQQDVERELWSAALRIQDFYGHSIDASALHESIESFASEFIEDCRKKSGRITGAYETSVPGERDIEVQDD